MFMASSSCRAVPLKPISIMEPKKNPKYDIHRKRGLILQVSFIISLAIVIMAFKWSVPVTESIGKKTLKKEYDEVLNYVPVVKIKSQEQTAPKPLKKMVTSLPAFREVSNSVPAEEDPIEPIDQSSPDAPELPFGSVELPPEKPTDTTFRVVEKMPEPVGGYEGFYRSLRNNMKYPKTAERSRASGKVFIEFTVTETGALENFKILKGIGYGCDEEAKRVLALTKWNAGKQRGRPVKVRLAQQIIFSLNE
ncbi:MAG: hypothetical protein C0490_12485 [Marivirga sp.]|nr:hypothetical protein [Marivirga sp.]